MFPDICKAAMIDNDLKFEKLKNDFIYNCDCSDRQLEHIKLRYSTAINSVRQMDRIKNLNNLIRVLEKRNLIEVDNVGILLEISDIMQQSRLKSIVLQYFQSIQLSDIGVFPDVPTNLYDRVRSAISEDIGHSWKDFARELDVKEGQIDELEEKYRRIFDRVQEILKMHKSTCETLKWQSTLLRALSNARRNDLRDKVQNIFDTHGF